MTRPALLCPASGTLAATDTTVDGVARCVCGKTVATVDGPTADLRIIARHGMFRDRVEAGAS